jgi:hypothetical protein
VARSASHRNFTSTREHIRGGLGGVTPLPVKTFLCGVGIPLVLSIAANDATRYDLVRYTQAVHQ